MRTKLFCAAAFLVGAMIGYPNWSEGYGTASPATGSAAPQTKKRITVPAGTRILIRMVDSIDSSKQKTGFRFTATLETNLQAEDTVIAPRGTTVYGRLTEASSPQRPRRPFPLSLPIKTPR